MHKYTHIHTIPPYLLMFGPTLPVISMQIKAPLVGRPESPAFINWSTFIQLLSSLSLLSTGAV